MEATQENHLGAAMYRANKGRERQQDEVTSVMSCSRTAETDVVWHAYKDDMVWTKKAEASFVHQVLEHIEDPYIFYIGGAAMGIDGYEVHAFGKAK